MSKQPEDALARLIEPDLRRLANMGVKKELQQQLADAILRDPDAWLDLKERVIQAWPYGRGPIKVVENQAIIAGPPKTAEFLLALLLRKKTGEGVIGDLSERFESDRRQYGAARARRIYWGRTLRSFRPLLVRMISRAIKWGVVVGALRRFF